MEFPVNDDEFYPLRVNILFYDRELLPISQSKTMLLFLTDFLSDNGELKKLSELKGAPLIETELINAIITDMEADGYYFGPGLTYRDGEPVGIYMDQPITITYQNDPASFSKLFPFRLIQVCRENRKWRQNESAEERLNKMLEFHLKESFNNDLNKFKRFLLALPGASGGLIRDYDDSIKLWLEQKNTGPSNQNQRVSPRTIAYALKFYKEVHNPTETDNRLYEKFANNHGSTWQSIKKEHMGINREHGKEFHKQNKKHIKDAIKLLKDRKSKDRVRDFLKNLNN